MALILSDWYTLIAVVFLLGGVTINSSDPRVEAVGWLLQGVIAILVAWGVQRIGETKKTLTKVELQGNSRSDKQDRTIEGLRRDLDAMRDEKHAQAETLAFERGSGAATQAAIATAAASEPPRSAGTQ